MIKPGETMLYLYKKGREKEKEAGKNEIGKKEKRNRRIRTEKRHFKIFHMASNR
jgi:hypothetical protein